MVSTKEKRSTRKGEGHHGKAEPASTKAAHDIDGLFQIPLAEFTPARNALAGRLKKAGRTEDAERVKALAKPPIAAWVANQLYWHHRKAFDELLAAGERFRVAQSAQLSGKSADLRAPLEARRTALSEMSRLAADILQRAGHSAGPDVMRRITTTLEAVSTYVSLPDAPQPGHLTSEVDPPGFETLAALVPQTGASGRTAGDVTRVLPFRQQEKAAKAKRRSSDPDEEARRVAEEKMAQLAAAKRLRAEAERGLTAARKAAAQAESRFKTAAARANEADKERAAAEKRFEKATADHEAARQQARHIAEEAEEAAQALEDAERALANATKALSDLE